MQQVIVHKMSLLWWVCVNLFLLPIVVYGAGQQAPQGDKLQREASHFNRMYYKGTTFNKRPNVLLMSAIKELPSGKALDLGTGQGRNAVYLAEKGWNVTGIDIAEVGLKQASTLARELGLKINFVNQDAEKFEYGQEQWDLVAAIYFDPRPYLKKIQASLKHGGIAVIEAYHRDATKRYRIGEWVVFESGELRELFKDFEILRYEEVEDIADFGLFRTRLVRLVARKK
jgi:SAM-dependent methyltransferase